MMTSKGRPAAHGARLGVGLEEVPAPDHEVRVKPGRDGHHTTHPPEAIYIAPDYSSEGVFYRSDGAVVDLDDLPLTEATQASLRAWIRWFETTLEVREREPGERYFATAEQARRFDFEGLRLWAVVRDELGEGWRVEYRSQWDALTRRAAELAEANGTPSVDGLRHAAPDFGLTDDFGRIELATARTRCRRVRRRRRSLRRRSG